MSILKTQDRIDLVSILENAPDLQNEEGRRQTLRLADLGIVLPILQLDGAPRIAVTRIVTFLEGYGRVAFNQHALGRFLIIARNYFGAFSEQRKLLDRIIKDYKLIELPAEGEPPKEKPLPDLAQMQEKIIGENTLRSIAFLERGLEIARSVVKIEVSNFVGTGFLITPELLITCNHVIGSATAAGVAKFLFNYELNFTGQAKPITEIYWKAGGFFRTNATLDYTVLTLENSPGSSWGIVPVSKGMPRKDERVNIIQHPGGLPKRISFQNNFVKYVDDRLLQYLNSTQPGSSGSPVLDDKWEAVGVHHSGGDLLEPTTGRRYFRNEGTLMQAILADLPADVRKQVSN